MPQDLVKHSCSLNGEFDENFKGFKNSLLYSNISGTDCKVALYIPRIDLSNYDF